MGKIESVHTRAVVIPLDRTTSFATREVRARHYAVVRVRDADGNEGIGFCYPGSFGGQIVSGAVRDLVAPNLVGEESLRVRGLWDEVYAATLLHGRTGAAMRALSAADIAVWDLNARSAGLPLWQYLGAVSDATVPAYASGGYYLEGKDAGALGAEVRGYVEAGHTAVKIKVGRVSTGEDAERIAAVREAVGPDVLVMLDANNAWRDLTSAVRAVRAWERYDPYWIEEPFSPDQILNHGRLASQTSIAVATGEIEAGHWRHRELLETGGVNILQTDAAVCGGITEMQRIAALADGFEAVISPHWFHDLHVHVVASTSNATFVEYFPDDQVLNFRRLVDRQLTVENGRIMLPTEPGLGFDFDIDALEQYSVEPWA